MEYHFKRQEISGDRVLFALSLDKKSGKERILIGSETEIIKKLWNDPDAMVYYDEIHPIGTLFINKRSDGTDWTDRGFMPLWNALHSNRWKQPELEQAASDFCAKMYQSGDPFAIYTAIRLWDGYLRAREPRDRERAAELFKIDLAGLISPLEKYSAENLLDRSITDAIRQSGDEMKMDVWYPARTDMECVTAYRSFLPIIMYYHARLSDWSLYFRSCKVCGRIFLAKSQKYTMCSDKCRQEMKTQAKRDFDARAIENGYDHLYKNETQRWRNQLNKAKKNASPDQLEVLEKSYQALRKEALKRKNHVKSGRSTEREFTDWILLQSL